MYSTNINNKYFIDTNIFIYAYTKIEKNKIKKANQIIEKAIIEEKAYISIQVIIEFINCVYNKIKKSNSEIYEKVDSISKTQNILYYNTNTIQNAIKLESKYKIHFFDALIVSTMLENNIYTIYSENEKDFKKIKEINVINPFK